MVRTPDTETQPLHAGSTIAGVRLVEPLNRGGKIDVWRGTWPDGAAGTAHVLYAEAHQSEKETFREGARRLAAAARDRALDGIVTIAATAPIAVAYVSKLATQGTMRDVPTLRWGLRDTVDFMQCVCRAVQRIHVSLGTMHGCLYPTNVLLDDDLRPVLSDVAMIRIYDSFDGSADKRHEYWAYTARELRIGHPPSVAADVFSLGRLLYFALHGEDPDEEDEPLPLLAALQYAEPGLVRIIRRCTARDPAKRYPLVEALMADLEAYDNAPLVGLPHPNALEGEGRLKGAADPQPSSSEAEPPAPTSERRLSASPHASDPPAEPIERVPHSSERPTPLRETAKEPVSSSRPRASSPPTAGTAGALRSRISNRSAAPLAPRKSSRPPGRRRSRSPIAAPTSGGASIEARIAGVVGVLFVAAGLVHAYLRAVPTTGATFGIVLGAVLIGFAVPVVVGPPLLTRSASALILGFAVWVFDPVAWLALEGRRAQLERGTAKERGARIAQLYDAGVVKFERLDLRGINLRGLHLEGVRFDRTRLDNAIFDDGSLTNVSLRGSRLVGCSFVGTDLRSMNMNNTIGWAETICDERTQMPPAWICQDGKPAVRVKLGATGIERRDQQE